MTITSTQSVNAPVAQMVEAADLKSAQVGIRVPPGAPNNHHRVLVFECGHTRVSKAKLTPQQQALFVNRLSFCKHWLCEQQRMVVDIGPGI